jgi:hypothetical protein
MTDFHDVLVSHTDAALAGLGRIPTSPQTMAAAEVLAGIMRAGGLSPTVVALGLDQLVLYVSATAFEDGLFRRGMDEEEMLRYYAGVHAFYAALPANRYPVLASIAPEHPDAPNWKTNAKYVRDMASQVSGGSTANGEKFFVKVRAAFDKLDELLAGSKPGGIEESADKVQFSEVAARNYLMIRMQRAYDAMKANINTEAIFKKETEKVNHEASILALLFRWATLKGTVVLMEPLSESATATA